jgi:plastocyanin
MRRRPIGLAVTAVWAAFAVAAPVVIVERQARSGGPLSGGSTVVMAQIAFKPSTLVVRKGTEVLFVNRDVAPHTVTAASQGIDSGTINPGRSFRLVVAEAVEYVCTIHPFMKAKLLLRA